MIDFKTYFLQLSIREKFFLGSGGILLVFYLLYALIYAPLRSSIAQNKVLLQAKQQDLMWMEQAYASSQLKSPAKVLTNGSLLTTITNQLHVGKLSSYVYHLEQTTSGDISINFSEVPYNDFILWLWELCNKQSIHLKNFVANSSDTAGIVSVNVTLSI